MRERKNAEHFCKLAELTGDYLSACEFYEQAARDGKPKAEILVLSKRTVILYNAIKDLINTDKKVINFEQWHSPEGVIVQHAEL